MAQRNLYFGKFHFFPAHKHFAGLGGGTPEGGGEL